jgi:predicted DNA-binding transcriptional regulator AlpA
MVLTSPNTDDPPAERLLSPADLAGYLQLTERALRDMRYQGRGPAYVKVGRLVRYRPEAVAEWLADNEAAA